MFWTTIVICEATGLVLIAISIPMALRRVPQNHLYGVRIKATLGDERIWYDCNEKAGKELAAVGALVCLATVPAAIFLTPITVILACTAIAVVGSVAVAVRSIVYARQLERQKPGDEP